MSLLDPADDAKRALNPLERLCISGQLRRLDVVFAQWIAAHDAQASAPVLHAAAWCSRAAGAGHLCLDFNLGERQLAACLAAAGPAAEAWGQLSAQIDPGLTPILPCDAAAAAEQLTSCGTAVWNAGVPGSGQLSASPLVLDGGRLYLRRHWAAQQRIASRVQELAADGFGCGPCISSTEEGSKGPANTQQEALLALLFPDAADSAGSRQQQQACRLTAQRRLTLITGGPGTGKTYTAARALVLLRAQHLGPRPLRVALAAPTGKAAARLRESVSAALASLRQQHPAHALLGAELDAELEPSTLHRLLGLAVGSARAGRPAPAPLLHDVVLVDEASMIDAETMDALLQALPSPARLVLLGDADQLASVEAGSVLADLTAAPPASALGRQTLRLQHSRRFGGELGRLARAVREGQSTEVERCLRGFGSAPASSPVQWHTLPPQSADTAAELALSARAAVSHAGWLQGLRETPSEATAYLAWVAHMLDGLGAFRVLCALREGPHGVAGLNLAIERLAQRKGWLRGGGQAYEGRPIMVTRNDAALKLFNGDIGILLRGPPSAQGGRELRAWFAHDGAANAERVRSVALTRLPAVETAFAMTVHKSQGSEFSHAMVVLPGGDSPLLTRELLYTGMTRARERLTLCGSEPQALLRALQRRTQRMSGLASLLSTQPLSTPVST